MNAYVTFYGTCTILIIIIQNKQMNETRIECNSLFTKSVCVDDIANSVCFSVFFSPCVFRKSYTLSLIDTHSSAQWRKNNNSNSKTSSMNTFLVHFIQRFLSNDGNKIRSQFTFVHLGLHRRRLNALDTFFLKKKSLSLAQRCIQLKKKTTLHIFFHWLMRLKPNNGGC